MTLRLKTKAQKIKSKGNKIRGMGKSNVFEFFLCTLSQSCFVDFSKLHSRLSNIIILTLKYSIKIFLNGVH